MPYEKKPGSGTLWVNNKKKQDNHPDRTGDALIHCPQCSHNFEVQLAGWVKEKANGEKFLSLSIKSKEDPGAGPRGPRTEEQRRSNPIAKRPTAPDPDLDAAEDDIPL